MFITKKTLVLAILSFLVTPLVVFAALAESKVTGADYNYTSPVSIDGDTAIIGISGSNYADVYARNPSTDIWTLQQRLTPSDGGGGFGGSVSVSGDVAVVGATNAGSVGEAYVFERSGGIWTEVQKLTPGENPVAYYGQAVAVSGDWAVVGTQYANGGYNGTVRLAGAAYAFKRNSGTGVWEYQQKLYDQYHSTGSGGYGSLFGSELDIEGGFLIIGAPSSDSGGGFAGQIFIYELNVATGSWRLKGGATGASFDNFGSEVAISSDTALIYASGESGSNIETVYAYARNPDTGVWYKQATFPPPSAGVRFGTTLSITNDLALIGASGDDESFRNSGAVYIEEREPGTSTWTETKIKASDASADTNFGGSVDVKGDLGVVASAGALYFFNGSAGVGDLTPPVVTSVSPSHSAASVAVDTSVMAIFNEAMDQATITTSTFTLANGGSVAGAVSYDTGTNTATFTPSANLAYSTTYIATITTGTADEAGNDLENDYTWTFTTAEAPDVTPPNITAVTPVDGATGVATDTVLNVTFDETMHATTVYVSSNFLLTDGIDPMPVTVAYDAGTNTASFTPSALLADLTSYTATVTTGMTDLAGNAIVEDYVWTFTTGVSPDVVPPSVISVTPGKDDADVATNTSVSATFSEDMDADTISDSSFTLSNGGAVAGSVSYDAGSKTAKFTPSAELSYSTTYTATVTTAAADVAGNGLDLDEVWTFTTGTAPDITAPTVTAVTPTDSATDVSLTTSITAAFDEEMDAATINATNFTLSASGAVAGAVSYDSDSTTATFVPYADLTEATTYTVTISTGTTDLAGNNLAADYSWNFTTLNTAVDSDGDGVFDSEDNYPNDQTRATPSSTTGTGKILIDTSTNTGTVLANCRSISAVDSGLNMTGKPLDYTFTDGLVGCDIENVTPGATIELSITFPTVYPDDARYYKVDSAGFFEFSGASINGKMVTLTLGDDGNNGDDTADDGVIQDPGGAASPKGGSNLQWWEGGCFLHSIY